MKKDAESARNEVSIFVVPCAVLLLLFLCCDAFAQSDAPEQILDYQSTIMVRQDASLRVFEMIRVRSAGIQIHHGIYRDFPTRYKDRLGNRYVVDFTVVRVLRDGKPEKFHVQDQSNGERIYIGDENEVLPPGEYTYSLNYTVNREIGFFADHDELYWNVTGNGWIFPIAHASATVVLPNSVPEAGIRMDGYTGPQGSREKAFTSSLQTFHRATFVSSQPLSAGEGLTIVVSWPKGYIQEPSGMARFRYFLEDNPSPVTGATGLILVLLYYVVVWFKVGRDPAKGSIMPIYEPPAGVSPAAMRYLVRMGFDDETLAVAVIDMAVKKFLSIKEDNGVFTLQKISDDEKLLAPEESAAAAKFFDKSQAKGFFVAQPIRIFGNPRGNSNVDSVADGHGKQFHAFDGSVAAAPPGVVVLTPNSGVLSGAVAAVKKALHDAEEKIYFVTNLRYLIPGLILSALVSVAMVMAETGDRQPVVGFLCVWLTAWSFGVFSTLVRIAVHLRKGLRAGGMVARDAKTVAIASMVSILPFVAVEIAALCGLVWLSSVSVVLILAALVVTNVLFHRLLKAPTSAGRALLDKIEGFRMFLQAVDGDRLNRLMPPDKTPELFEKYLPYAVALDSEQAWAQQFAGVLERAQQTAGYSPTWYVASNAFAMSTFAGSFSDSFSNAISASASTPGSSSGGGGGGSSGGGGGGGGGGGW